MNNDYEIVIVKYYNVDQNRTAILSKTYLKLF